MEERPTVVEETTETTETTETKEEVYSIKEIMELLDGLEVFIKFTAKILEDGKVNGSDIMALQIFAREFDVLKDAVSGVELVLKEAKDLDQDEVIAIMLKLVAMFKVVKTIKLS